ncbi:hypothetical protein C8F01DRAFT_1110461 [Mycena amicta]|nr:hypothetical protein C8F01DRAFT_1110461 [Mycena amicta]
MSIPAFVGGVALRQYDLPGASIFAAGYGLLLPILIYRGCVANSRTAVIFEILPFAIERCVVFCLRATAAAKPGFENSGLSEYFQVTLALEFIALSQIASKLIRTVFVNTTNPPPEEEPDSEPIASGKAFQKHGSENGSSTTTLPVPNALVHTSSSEWIAARDPKANADGSDTRRRYQYRRANEAQFLFLYLPALVMAIVATRTFYANTDVSKNHLMQRLRYASTSLGTALVLWELVSLGMAQKRVPGVDMRAVNYLGLVTSLLIVPAIYRLCVMRHTTPDTSAHTHAALNTGIDKVGFYILHVLPEWLSVALLSIVNVKQVCNLGIRGDFRSKDEPPEKREKRWAKLRAKKEKRAEKKRAKAAKKNGGEIELRSAV